MALAPGPRAQYVCRHHQTAKENSQAKEFLMFLKINKKMRMEGFIRTWLVVYRS
jgi:hypothetical protein